MTAPAPQCQPSNIATRLIVRADSHDRMTLGSAQALGFYSTWDGQLMRDAAARIEELEAALRPFADFADPRNTIPPDTILTAGSPLARKQITMANCYAARAALEAKP